MYAIVNISGKQFKATAGARARIPKHNGDEGTKLVFNDVLLFHNGRQIHTGNPTIKGVSVTATILNQGREKKILVYKKKRRKGYQRKNGHRQNYTDIEFQDINSNIGKPSTKNQNIREPSIQGVQEEE